MSMQFLLERRSVIVARLGDPGPSKSEILELVRAAIRVPDHKVLAPWRFLVFSGEARRQFGEEIAKIYQQLQGEDCVEQQVENERNRFLRAPIVIAAISSPKESDTVPQSEQVLSAGAACQNILNGVAALGYAAQWVTEWIAYDPAVLDVLGLDEGETIAGFIYIGTAQQSPKERRRAQPEEVMSYWNAD